MARTTGGKAVEPSGPEQLLRRASYGPNSREVRVRGARTRSRIVEVTLALLAERGYHDTLVDDIADQVGVSRATLYQYFESKEQIFRELLDECGAALMRVVRRVGPLGPTEQGLDNLHWWLGEWSWVYDKYATVFVQWGQIGSADTTLGPVVTGFVERYSLRLAQRLVEAGMPEGEASEIAGALLVFVNRVHYYRHVGAVRPMPEDEVIDSLALIVQLMLFPTTPLDVLRTIEVTPSPRRARVARPITLDLLRFEGLSARANRTVDRLLHAGSRQFVEVGYSRSTVEDVVIRAEVARGTFYKYFNDKLDLLTVLADEAGQALPTFAERLHDALHADDRHASLRACLRDFEPVHARYAGVLRAWIEQQPDDAHVTAVGQEVKRRWAEAFDSALYSVERGYALDLNVASLMLLAILERTFDGLPQLTAFGELNRLVELAATLIERGLLNPGSVAAA